MDIVPKWQRAILSLVLSSLVFSCKRKNHVEPEPISEQTMILVNVTGVYDRYVVALDGATGVEKWRLKSASEWIVAKRNLYLTWFRFGLHSLLVSY